MSRYEDEREGRQGQGRGGRNPYRNEPGDSWTHEGRSQPEQGRGWSQRGQGDSGYGSGYGDPQHRERSSGRSQYGEGWQGGYEHESQGYGGSPEQ